MDQIPSDATKEGATPRELMNMLCGRNAAIHDDIINFAWVRPSAPGPSPPAPLPLGEGGRRPGEGVTKVTTLRVIVLAASQAGTTDAAGCMLEPT